MGFITIKKILGKDVTFILMESESLTPWVNAYVLFKRKPLHELGNETFDEYTEQGVVLGVDTAHSHNSKLTFDELKLDAERQIKEIIKNYKKNTEWVK